MPLPTPSTRTRFFLASSDSVDLLPSPRYTSNEISSNELANNNKTAKNSTEPTTDKDDKRNIFGSMISLHDEYNISTDEIKKK